MNFQKFSALMVAFAAAFSAQGKLTPEQIARLPPPASVQVDFARDVKPIFDSACVKCHGKSKDKGGFSLETRDSFMKGGDSGAPIVSGKSAQSLIIELVSGLDPENVMPKKGSKLKPEQVALLRAWIDQGANWPVEIAFKKAPVLNLHPRKPIVPVVPGLPNPVDRLLAPYFAAHQVTPGAVVDDRVFARRVYLDTIGLLPTTKELNEFLADSRADKRNQLVVKLLRDHRRYAEHWMTFWNDLLRNDYDGVGYGFTDDGRHPISTWLFNSLYRNAPYNQFVSELVNPDVNSDGFINGILWRGEINASQRPPLQAAQSIAQAFLGVNLKCASCHDSFINDYTLADAYGLAAVYATNDFEMAECDKPTGKYARVKFLYPELGVVDGSPPKAERTKQLAAVLTSRSNGRLTRTMVNRLWARFMGRGLVEPVDDMDAPSWNPDLLDWMADEMADSNYDLRRAMWWILTSRAYQLPAVDLAEQSAKSFVFTGPALRRMNAEQFRDALGRLTDVWYPLPSPGLKLTAPTTAGATNGLIPKSARWIWTEAGAGTNTPPVSDTYLRKKIGFTNLPPKAFATVACDGNFTLYVNGKVVGQGKDPEKAHFIPLQPFLRAGENVLAVAVAKRPRGARSAEGRDARPAGFFFAATFPGQNIELVSDRTWVGTRTKSNGWEQLEFDAAGWIGAVELGAAETTSRNMSAKLEESLGLSLVHDSVRAGLVAADPLMVALGRPNREQITTTRPMTATTLQGLEMTNGDTLNKVVKRGAEKLLADGKRSPGELVENMFLTSLGRKPTSEESKLALELIGAPAKQEGVEDLLWSVAMLPEFQLIY